MSTNRYADGGDLLSTSHRVVSEEMRIAGYLREVRDGQLYTEDGYADFKDFCERGIGMPIQTANSMIGSLIGSEVSRN
jgi:hypothetical protein